MKKVKVLGIAPHETLMNALIKIAARRDDIALDCYMGDMNEGVEIARYHEGEGYDVIISRGATAHLLKDAVRIPVISVGFSAYDILRAIRLAENYPYQYAIVGFPEFTKQSRVLCSLLQRENEVVTVYHEEDTEKVIRNLKYKGISMIVCGTVGAHYAKQMGLTSILVTTGEESVEDAVEQAVKLSQGYSYMREKKILYEQILKNEAETWYVLFDSEGNQCFSTWDEALGDLKKLLEAEYKNVQADGIKKIQILKNVLYQIEGKYIWEEGNRYTVFRVREEKIPLGEGRQGLFFSNRKQAENYYYNSFFGASGALGFMEKELQGLEQVDRPIVIIGEEGSGKDIFARYLYLHSLLSSRPFVTIDCEAVNNRTWSFLMTGESSPFTERNQTFYFRNINHLSENWCRQLQFMMLERDFHRNNRVILTCSVKNGGRIPEHLLRFINQFSCHCISMPALRERIAEMSMLTSLYIGKKNEELSKQILGFEPGCMEMLQAYNWPCNYAQLKRVLDELTASAEGYYISRSALEHALKQETAMLGGAETGQFDFNRTLDEINADIVVREVKRCAGNQTAAARNLGISRTTLWRYLKKHE